MLFLSTSRIRYSQRRRHVALFCTVLLAVNHLIVDAFVHLPPTSSRRAHYALLFAKRKKNQRDTDDFNRWYEDVDDNASPDDVFWEEMQRQRSLTEAATSTSEPLAPTTIPSTSNTPLAQQVIGIKQEKSADATLAEYTAFMVNDNWLDEELAVLMEGNDDYEFYENVDEQNLAIDREFQEMTRNGSSDDSAWMTSDEPWDNWGQVNDDPDMRGVLKVAPKESEFLFHDEDDGGEEAARLEAELMQRISKLRIKSKRLENARNNPKAKAFFARPPDEVEGLDRMWASAMDNVCFKNLKGVFRDYGVEFADNFGDWQDGCVEDGLFSIEDVASFKARKVYEVTGLPCIASRTSFEIEPVATGLNNPGGRITSNVNPRVASGYRFNDIGNHVDYCIEALKPVSEPTRVTRFRTCLCYYDGEMEVFDYGVLDCDIHFASSLRTFIPVAAAVNELCQTLQLTFGLEYQKWLKKRTSTASHGYGDASIKLRDRVLKEAKVLPNDIVDVSEFMDSKIDVNLMDECAKELVSKRLPVSIDYLTSIIHLILSYLSSLFNNQAEKFMDTKPNKILTVATTGLVIALPMAKVRQVELADACSSPLFFIMCFANLLIFLM